jgi:galactokinase
MPLQSDSDGVLFDAFTARYGAPPTHVSRAPGRVNLIGEHTDYNDLPVLPMALQREVRLALRPREDRRVRLTNVLPEFAPLEFEIAPGIPPSEPGDWGNYAKAPADHLARHFSIERGFDGLLASDVPVASGLSSSSALVNAVGLALAHLNELGTEPLALASLMAEAERYTGTRGGGMDQAISMGARAGHAARIDFAPLRMHHVPIPSDWRFVVADTGVRAEKSGAAQRAYNLRRAECEQALEVVGEELVRTGGVPRPPSSYPAMLQAVRHDGALTAGESVLTGNLLKRFRHVVTEAHRVGLAADMLLSADLAGFGNLMDASHGSLRTDYNVSSSELDELVALAKEGGAVGARLTGAGFGGCIVALAPLMGVDDVVASLWNGYWGDRDPGGVEDSHVFVAVPSAGATCTSL